MTKKLFVIVFILYLARIYGQSGWTADLRVTSENYIQNTEVNVNMIVDLYYNGTLITPQADYKYELYRYFPQDPNSTWELRITQYGTNLFGTHTYQDSTIAPFGKFDLYVK